MRNSGLGLFRPHYLNPVVYLTWRGRAIWRIWPVVLLLARAARRAVQVAGLVLILPLLPWAAWRERRRACPQCGRRDELEGAGAGCAACRDRAAARYARAGGGR